MFGKNGKAQHIYTQEESEVIPLECPWAFQWQWMIATQAPAPSAFSILFSNHISQTLSLYFSNAQLIFLKRTSQLSSNAALSSECTLIAAIAVQSLSSFNRLSHLHFSIVYFSVFQIVFLYCTGTMQLSLGQSLLQLLCTVHPHMSLPEISILIFSPPGNFRQSWNMGWWKIFRVRSGFLMDTPGAQIAGLAWTRKL